LQVEEYCYWFQQEWAAAHTGNYTMRFICRWRYVLKSGDFFKKKLYNKTTHTY